MSGRAMAEATWAAVHWILFNEWSGLLQRPSISFMKLACFLLLFFNNWAARLVFSLRKRRATKQSNSSLQSNENWLNEGKNWVGWLKNESKGSPSSWDWVGYGLRPSTAVELLSILFKNSNSSTLLVLLSLKRRRKFICLLINERERGKGRDWFVGELAVKHITFHAAIQKLVFDEGSSSFFHQINHSFSFQTKKKKFNLIPERFDGIKLYYNSK